MHAIKGGGAELTFSVATQATMMQGAGQCCLDEDAPAHADYFAKVLKHCGMLLWHDCPDR